MNGVTERYEIKIKQTSKGIWYCDGLTVTNADEKIMIKEADQIMTQIEAMLMEHNQAEDEPKKEEK